MDFYYIRSILLKPLFKKSFRVSFDASVYQDVLVLDTISIRVSSNEVVRALVQLYLHW